MDTVTLEMRIPCTLYPTLTVRKADWEKAKARVAAGEKPVLVGGLGGCGCRGERLSGGLDQVTLLRLTEYGSYEAESETWGIFGNVYLYEGPNY